MTTYEAAAASSVFGVVAVLVCGLLITGALIWAVRLGIKVRRREPRPPRRTEQPTRPATSAVHDGQERREPDEVPVAADESERLTPHQLNPSGTKRSEDQTRPRWDSRSGGSFGSGGPGRT
ncbi:DUF6479 family protein [Streptomyces sp. NPDC001388]|uniref:DUF6479 family protein n=1 Tax=unclassified Streptomyces TaxID=2593676 RepID=UPI0036BFD6A2